MSPLNTFLRSVPFARTPPWSALSHPDAVLVGEDQLVRLQLDAIGLLALVAGPRVRGPHFRVLHPLHPGNALEHRVDLAEDHRTAERPAVSIWAAPDGVEVAVERLERRLLQPGRVG